MLRGAGVVRRGKFTLTGGGSADFYIDVKRVTGKPRAFAAVVRALAVAVPKSCTAVASDGYGGLPLAAAVALRRRLPLVAVRAEKRTHGTARTLEGHIPTRTDRIALVDDVYTTGGSLRAMEAALRPTGARVALRLVVVNRSGKRPPGVRALVDVKEVLQ